MATTTPAYSCDQCGADMDEVETWSSKSPPLIGQRIHFTEYRCPDCGNDVLYRRGEDDDEWQRA